MQTQAKKKVKKLDHLAERKKRGLNQSQYWSRLGVTQSGGSRYETGRAIPKPVELLAHVVYVLGVELPEFK